MMKMFSCQQQQVLLVFVASLVSLVTNNNLGVESKVIDIGWRIPEVQGTELYSRTEAEVGDVIKFTWDETSDVQHNVYYEPSGSCVVRENEIFLGDTSGIEYTITSEDQGKPLFFVCHVGNHCQQGLHVTIHVSGNRKPIKYVTLDWRIPEEGKELYSRLDARVGDIIVFDWDPTLGGDLGAVGGDGDGSSTAVSRAGVDGNNITNPYNHNVYLEPSGSCNDRSNEQFIGDTPGISYEVQKADQGEPLFFVCHVDDHCDRGLHVTIEVLGDDILSESLDPEEESITSTDDSATAVSSLTTLIIGFVGGALTLML